MDRDLELSHDLVGADEDFEMWSDAQITDLLSEYFVTYAEADADFYLADSL